ncbi:hypothetical protein [Sphaerisporangium aureirubrum]|uniref:Uncharacterized protein n=1 Tax=Sphaerisporangium aureirubrum TaxID=1544736 RepID=A0ABW1NWT5_9ACTN
MPVREASAGCSTGSEAGQATGGAKRLAGGGEAFDLAAQEDGRVAEPADDLADGGGVLTAAPFLLDAVAQPVDEVQALVCAEHAVGGVGHLADVLQDELVGALDHSRHTAPAGGATHPFG